ncbi:thioesterase [Aquisphaera insulae]|uniref:thioesterase n=1 Tax=Aquisphaera insulae TaxID=2712864 RepID=UPI0013ED3F1B|nr:thioesterase [Aquisphaera insulae]
MAKKAAKPRNTETAAAPEGNEGAHGKTEESDSRNAHGRRMPASKTDAIRMAMAAGFDSPQAGSAYIKSEFGLDVSPQHFSSTKSQLKSKEGEARGKPGRKPNAAIDGYLAPPPKPQAPGEQPDLLAAMEAMKPLVEALGAEKVKRIADLLG